MHPPVWQLSIVISRRSSLAASFRQGWHCFGLLFIWTRFGDPSGHPTASSSVIGRFVASNRPSTIEPGLWGRHSLHQSLPDKNLFHGVIPDGASRSGIIFPICASA